MGAIIHEVPLPCYAVRCKSEALRCSLEYCPTFRFRRPCRRVRIDNGYLLVNQTIRSTDRTVDIDYGTTTVVSVTLNLVTVTLTLRFIR